MLILAGSDPTLMSLISEASTFVKIIMFILVIASIWSWAIAVDKIITFRLLKTRADRFEETFWSGRTLEDLSAGLAGDVRDPMARVFAAAMREWEESKATASRSDGAMHMAMQRIDSVMNMVINREIGKAERGMTFLATIGATSLFIGLLGTVVGIIIVFLGISKSQNADFTVVAPGVSEALIATALALICAIPAVAFYNIFAAALDKYSGRLEAYADELSTILSRKMTKDS